VRTASQVVYAFWSDRDACLNGKIGAVNSVRWISKWPRGFEFLLASAALGLYGAAAAQLPQNPSPMVEHTRAHPRLQETTPPGRREALELGALFLPARLKLKSSTPLLFFFHGGTWLPEVAAARSSNTAVISIQIGAGSGVYARAFADAQRFPNLLREAEKKAGVTFAPVALGGAPGAAPFAKS